MDYHRIGDTAMMAEGDGPPVILAHGMGLNRHMWQWQLPALTPRFRVIRYDLLGHGDSDKPVKRYRMDDLVDQLARLMDGLELERCALAGFSLGGMLVQAMAVAHPERVSALAILNSAHDRNEEQRAGMRARLEQVTQSGPAAMVEPALARWFTEDFTAREPGIIELVRQWMKANDPAVYPLVYRVLAEGDRALATSIAAIRCPTLALSCEHDSGNSPDMARRIAALIPGARVEILPRLKHMGLVEDAEAVNAILAPFLEDALRAV